MPKPITGGGPARRSTARRSGGGTLAACAAPDRSPGRAYRGRGRRHLFAGLYRAGSGHDHEVAAAHGDRADIDPGIVTLQFTADALVGAEDGLEAFDQRMPIQIELAQDAFIADRAENGALGARHVQGLQAAFPDTLQQGPSLVFGGFRFQHDNHGLAPYGCTGADLPCRNEKARLAAGFGFSDCQAFGPATG
jgi:hypothetical protein